MKKILTDAANIGAVTARAIAFKVRGEDAYFYPNSAWRYRSSAATSSKSRRASATSMVLPSSTSSARA